MRLTTIAVAVASIALGALEARAVGPSAVPQIAAPAPLIQQTALEIQNNGIREETPNQGRRRLGQKIEASYPPPDYGEALETPNHQRQHLAQSQTR